MGAEASVKGKYWPILTTFEHQNIILINPLRENGTLRVTLI